MDICFHHSTHIHISTHTHPPIPPPPQVLPVHHIMVAPHPFIPHPHPVMTPQVKMPGTPHISPHPIWCPTATRMMMMMSTVETWYVFVGGGWVGEHGCVWGVVVVAVHDVCMYMTHTSSCITHKISFVPHTYIPHTHPSHIITGVWVCKRQCPHTSCNQHRIPCSPHTRQCCWWWWYIQRPHTRWCVPSSPHTR